MTLLPAAHITSVGLWGGTEQIFVDELLLSHTAGIIGRSAHICLIGSSSVTRQPGSLGYPVTMLRFMKGVLYGS